MNAATQAFLVQARANGSTAAEASAALAADVATGRNILTDDLAGFLTGTTLFQSFIAWKAGAPGLEAFAGAFATLDYILLNLRGRVVNGKQEGGFIKTIDPGIAAQMAQMIAGFKQAGLMTDAEEAGFLALGGGYRYERLTAEEVTAHWAAADTSEALAALRAVAASAYNAVAAAIDGGERDPEALAAVFAAGLEG